MKKHALLIILFFCLSKVYGQGVDTTKVVDRKNAVYFELAGRGYFSLNYERGWGTNLPNRVSGGFGWNHHETQFTPEEVEMYGLDTGHEVLPYLSFFAQYTRLIGKKRSKLELGAGTVITFYDLARLEFANALYETESYVNLYPVIGYRFEGYNGFLFMFTFNPLIQLPQGYFWPIPGISLGYRF